MLLNNLEYNILLTTEVEYDKYKMSSTGFWGREIAENYMNQETGIEEMEFEGRAVVRLIN